MDNDSNVVPHSRPDPRTAWLSKDAARWYARDVNDRFHVEQVDLSFQVNLLLSLVSKDARIADIGCGTGALSLLLAHQGHEVTGFDISASMLSQMIRRSRDLHLTAVEADIFQLGPENGLFDAAVSRWVLPHFGNWQEIVHSVSRVLKPGGVFVFDVKNKEHYDFVDSLPAWEGSAGKDGHFSFSSIPETIDPYTTKPSSHAVTASESEIREVLDNAGFHFEARYSLGLFSSNLLLTGGADEKEIQKRLKKINRLVGKSETMRSLFEDLAESLTLYLPPSMVMRSLVVARRKQN
jgi:ubiquinone/menaquinone biosynthesis C-methylase UbiE